MAAQMRAVISFHCPPGQQGALALTAGFLQPGWATGDTEGISHPPTLPSFRSQALANPSQEPRCPFTQTPGD